MSYYGNSNNYSSSNNNWNSRPGGNIEEVDLSSGGYPPSQSDPFTGPGTGGGPSAYGHPNQPPAPSWQRPGGISGQINSATTKHYNDFLEQQGIPAISPEDMEILRECGRESLYFRCLPLTAALCGGLVFAARTRPTFQPKWLHYMGATFLGYFVGKVSYRGTCETKLINSRSNSPFVNAIRKKRGLYVEEFNSDGGGPTGDMPAFESDWTTQGAQSQSPSTYGIGEFDREEKPQPYSAWNSRGIGNSNGRAGPFGNQDGGDFDDGGLQDGQPSGRASSISYDDLRQRNRASYKG